MTLDPVHFAGIAELARRIDHDVDDSDHRDLAETAWTEFLDPLYRDGTTVLEPLGDLARRRVDVEDIALTADEFESMHGLDSGTINPTTFKNGLVLDVAQAAMSSVPSDLDVHRSRTVVATAHSNDDSLRLDDEWLSFDDDYGRGKIIHAPRVTRHEKMVVHALSLYFAESTHALAHAEDVDDLLVLDGPIYPKAMVNWLDVHPELAELLQDEDVPRTIVRNYVSLVEEFVDRGVPLVGFVKNNSSKGVIRALREKTVAPWVNDAAFFSQVLEPESQDALTVTNWFVSRSGPDSVFAASGDELGLDYTLDPELYEVTFCMVYDPREDIVYKVEAPYAVTEDEDMRQKLERQLLKEVALQRGPPFAVAKADELARISRAEKRSLVRSLEETFDADRDRTYDQVRWQQEYGATDLL